MAFLAKDTKLLWGRAAGRCSKCRDKLSEVGAGNKSFLTGEMAHQIAQSTDGPRGGLESGSDKYDNLILLCPTCHKKIDKAPDGTYSVDILKDWKKSHEDWVDNLSKPDEFDSVIGMALEIHGLLIENNIHYIEYGPNSLVAKNSPGSTAQTIWAARKLDVLLPNNKKILRVLDNNNKLLVGKLKIEAVKFKMHALAFEGNQYERVEQYPLFPISFQEEIEGIIEWQTVQTISM